MKNKCFSKCKNTPGFLWPSEFFGHCRKCSRPARMKRVDAQVGGRIQKVQPSASNTALEMVNEFSMQSARCMCVLLTMSSMEAWEREEVRSGHIGRSYSQHKYHKFNKDFPPHNFYSFSANSSKLDQIPIPSGSLSGSCSFQLGQKLNLHRMKNCLKILQLLLLASSSIWKQEFFPWLPRATRAVKASDNRRANSSPPVSRCLAPHFNFHWQVHLVRLHTTHGNQNVGM